MATTTNAVVSVREHMKTQGLDAYIVPSSDAHMSEYVAHADKRRAYLSGFTGSAGTAVVVAAPVKAALLWTDSRYFLQAAKQLLSHPDVDGAPCTCGECWRLMKSGPETPTVEAWLAKELPKESIVGVDPRHVSLQWFNRVNAALEAAGKHLKLVNVNLVDLVWENKPVYPLSPIEIYSTEFSGQSFADKLTKVRVAIVTKKADVMLVSSLDQVAWLLNIRARDIPCSPFVRAYVAVELTMATLFVDAKQVSPQLEEYFCKMVTIQPYEAVGDYLKAVCADKKQVMLDNGSANMSLYSAVPMDQRIAADSPITMLKAEKNQTELDCLRQIQIRDGVALAQLLSWLEDEISKGTHLTELDVVDKLEYFRGLQKDYAGPSFETIAASGPNGAIIHYEPTKEDFAVVSKSMFLLDAGGQYLGGTTDTTRTVHLGEPTPHERDCWTRVLKGHIALASAIFPSGTNGASLDVLARFNLWKVGLNYGHGTGHGVGSFLGVHEGPQGIGSWATTPFKPGMTVTIEPGYYEEGAFGVRLENEAVVVPSTKFVKPQFLCFDCVSLVPFQAKLIAREIMTADELEWLNAYHAACRKFVLPLLDPNTVDGARAIAWYEKQTAPLV